ncbi:MAG: response regulator transcription factor [Anaerolineales bacterium]
MNERALMDNSDKISIIMVDDHAIVRQGLRAFLQSKADMEVIGEASNGEEAIRKAARGEAVLHPKVAARLVHEIQGETRTKVNPFTELSERELEVLNLIAKGSNNHEIADQLVISEKTVKSHVSNILSKLPLADRTQAAVFAWKEGIMRRDRDQ